MTWTAILDNARLSNGRLQLNFTFTNGGSEFPESMFVGPGAVIEDIVRDRIVELDATDALLASIKLGPVTPSGPKVDSSTNLDRAEVALKNALGAYEDAVRVSNADSTFDVTKYKQAVSDAAAAVEALKK